MKPQSLHAHEDWLLDFVYGELPPQEAQAVKSHLEGCSRCSELLAGIERGAHHHGAAAHGVRCPTRGWSPCSPTRSRRPATRRRVPRPSRPGGAAGWCPPWASPRWASSASSRSPRTRRWISRRPSPIRRRRACGRTPRRLLRPVPLPRRRTHTPSPARRGLRSRCRRPPCRRPRPRPSGFPHARGRHGHRALGSDRDQDRSADEAAGPHAAAAGSGREAGHRARWRRRPPEEAVRGRPQGCALRVEQRGHGPRLRGGAGMRPRPAEDESAAYEGSLRAEVQEETTPTIAATR